MTFRVTKELFVLFWESEGHGEWGMGAFNNMFSCHLPPPSPSVCVCVFNFREVILEVCKYIVNHDWFIAVKLLTVQKNLMICLTMSLWSSFNTNLIISWEVSQISTYVRHRLKQGKSNLFFSQNDIVHYCIHILHIVCT